MCQDRAATILAGVLVLTLLAWFWCRGERFIAANGPTFDEGVHLAAGYCYWTTGNFALNAEDPPLLKLLWALPLLAKDAPAYPRELAATTDNHWEIADTWLYGSHDPRSLLDPARRVNLVLGCGMVLLSGWWAYRVFGSKLAAVAAAAFTAADPNLLALSCILSTDAGLTFFGFLTCYLMWEYAGHPSRGWLLALGISLGLTLSTKFSAVAIVAGLVLAGAIHIGRGQSLALPGKEQERGFRPVLELAVRLLAIAMVTVAATYALINFDLWGKGLKFQLTRGSHGDGVMYLNGQLSRTGWYHYFLVAILVKVPLGLLVASAAGFLLGVVTASGNTREASRAARRNTWLVVPPLVFFALASYSRVDMGIRVVLPVLPFLGLLGASVLVSGYSLRPVRLVLVGGCLAWCLLAAEQANPHEVAYFNEMEHWLEPGRPVVADSNLDWGQGLPALKAWMDAEKVEAVYLAYFGTDRPEAHGIRFQQLPGYGRSGPAASVVIPGDSRQIVAVSVNHLYGLFLNDPNTYSWLRERRPVSKLDGSIRVYDLTGDPEAVARVRKLTLK